MQDVLLLAVMAAFFGLAYLFVKACERVIGADVEVARGSTAPDADEIQAA